MSPPPAGYAPIMTAAALRKSKQASARAFGRLDGEAQQALIWAGILLDPPLSRDDIAGHIDRWNNLTPTQRAGFRRVVRQTQ